MFDVTGDVSLPAGMTLSMLFAPDENVIMDLITCSGTLDGSGTTWNIDANRTKNWAVVTTQNTIRAQYTKPGTKLLVR